MSRLLIALAFLVLAGEARASGFWDSGVELNFQCRIPDDVQRAA